MEDMGSKQTSSWEFRMATTISTVSSSFDQTSETLGDWNQAFPSKTTSHMSSYPAVFVWCIQVWLNKAVLVLYLDKHLEPFLQPWQVSTDHNLVQFL